MNRSKLKITTMLSIAVIVVFTFGRVQAAEKPLNILFIAVDDLRPELGCYGVEHMKTPNIDRLASNGTLFNRAYCQQAVCNPTRVSLLTGRRPDTTKVYDLQTHLRVALPDCVTLPQYFKQNGYTTLSMGKIYHGGLDDPASWSEKSWYPGGPGYLDPDTLTELEAEGKRLRKLHGARAVKVLERDPKTGAPLKVTRPSYRVRGPSWECYSANESDHKDGKTTAHALETMEQLAAADKPFFLAVGYLKPHLPFVAPKKYFDLYPREEVRKAPNPFPPEDVPPLALTSFGELRNYNDTPKKGPISDEQSIDLRRAYYASVSFIDAQIGQLLEGLDRLGLRDRTVIILWGDHGWQLGEHGLWCKHTNFEVATRVPMIVSAPGQANAGAKSDALVEFVDIYPSLCELAGLKIPAETEGLSFVPVMNNPARPWKSVAMSQYPRGSIMGYSMRTDRYRYTEWQSRSDKNTVVARELYDHQNDPDENVNLADRPENAELVKKLSQQLAAGPGGALPVDR